MTPDDFSFSVHVEEVCVDWRKLIENTRPATTHSDWDKGHTVRLPVEKDRPHRPEISEELEEEVTETANTIYGVPAEELPFEKRLRLIVDSAEEYYERLDCQVAVIDVA